MAGIMGETSIPELESLARTAARELAGADLVDGVAVELGPSSDDEPNYFFSFLMDVTQTSLGPGLFRIRLGQRIRDALLARRDQHYPLVQILNRKDWGRGWFA